MKKTYITSGLLKGSYIDIAGEIRPTQERIRKAIFDILQQIIKGSSFLELYAGSGAVGIEALSNGAKEVAFVEKDIRCCRAIEKNLSRLGLTPKERGISILATETLRSIEIFHKNKKRFDIVFLDPPYYGELAKKTLQKLSAYDILTPHGFTIVEHSKKDCLEETIDNLTCFKQKRYGDTVLSFYKKT